MAEKKYLMHVISGTHWDREWRHTAEQSKLRLADLVDQIIDTLENHPDYETFVLDGGMIVVADYLTVRPDRAERLRKLIEAGRIELVSWYTLPDTFTVAPEALIRNLLLGRRMAAAYGGAMATGYTATSYGQTSQLPQLYRGFGIATAVFYRGTNRHELPPLFLWEGRDGSRLHVLKTFDEATRQNWFYYVHTPLVNHKAPRDFSYPFDAADVPVHLCDEGLYERAFTLLREDETFDDDPEALRAALNYIVEQARPYAIGRHLLALNMEDNDRPFSPLPRMIAALNAVSEDVQIVQDSLDRYMDTVIAESEVAEMHVHKGELRYAVVEPGINGLLGTTQANRPKLKILNENAETLLVHLAEPLAAAAFACGAEYPRTHLDRAWRYLLQNQAHDSICGAAVDQAHEDMLYRFSVARTVAEEVAARSAVSLLDRVDTASGFAEGDYTITLFNTLAQARRAVACVVIDIPRAGGDGVVDPCSGIGANTEDVRYFDILDAEGGEIEHEVLSTDPIQIAVERELDTKAIKFQANRRRILLNVDLPPMGYRTLALRPRQPRYVPHPATGQDRPLIAREGGRMENDLLAVQIHPNGTFRLEHKPTGHRMENLHYFTDSGQIGSAHRDILPRRNPTHTSLGCHAAITMEQTGRLRGVYRIDLTMSVPAAAAPDGSDRLRETVALPVTTWLTLEKGCGALKLRTRLTNAARDHKLRVHFPSGVYAETAAVESAFAVDSRPIRWTITGDNHEKFFPFQPMQNFVDVSDGEVGLAVLNRGLREYEVADDGRRTIAVTLLRTHRAYMTANCDMTPEELDRYTGLHCFGTQEYRYALYPHAGDWQAGRVVQATYEHKVDVKAIQGVPKPGTLPPTMSLFTITPSDSLMLAALKQSEDGGALVLRLWNTSSRKLDAKIETPLPLAAATKVRLDETPVEDLSVRDGKIALPVGPHEIVTVLLKTA